MIFRAWIQKRGVESICPTPVKAGPYPTKDPYPVVNAIGDCLTLWREMERTGSNDKEETVTGVLPGKSFSSDCPACEWANLHGINGGDSSGKDKGECVDECILKSVWKHEYGCCGNGSPYSEWCDATTTEGRKKWAGKMVKRIKKALAKELLRVWEADK